MDLFEKKKRAEEFVINFYANTNCVSAIMYVAVNTDGECIKVKDSQGLPYDVFKIKYDGHTKQAFAELDN